MKRLIILILIAAAAWYGWKSYPQLLSRTPSHEAVIENQTGVGITRLRFTADGQTQVREALATGERAVFKFKVNNDSDCRLDWEWATRIGEKHWAGGRVTKGPIVARHVMQIMGDGEVIYRAEPLS